MSSVPILRFPGDAAKQLARDARERGFIIDHNDALADAFEKARRYARMKLHILIRGESGTGKEPLSLAIHSFLPEKDAPIVEVNVAGLDENLAASELFGHVKGSFTNAHCDREGRFELARGGTLMLDEIGDISLGLQSKLLRVFETKKVQRVGDNSFKDVSNVQVITATNKPLEFMVEDHRFSDAFFRRIKQAQIHLPPYRDRNESHRRVLIEYVATHLQGVPFPASITKEAIDLIVPLEFEGNVREMRDLILCAYSLAHNEEEECVTIKPEHIREAKISANTTFSEPPSKKWDLSCNDRLLIQKPGYDELEQRRIALDNLDVRVRLSQGVIDLDDVTRTVEKAIVRELMFRFGNNQSAVADELDITRGKVRELLAEMGPQADENS